mmetsp:Transcript_47502/g.158337  ORF Transcript_47502/g.158337 Transcript_47502/m.158337 type:complete len:216 (+) Transcript_47502:197-844(+)
MARNDSWTSSRSSLTALYLVASEPDTITKTLPPTAVAERSARRSTVFALYESGANLSAMRRYCCLCPLGRVSAVSVQESTFRSSTCPYWPYLPAGSKRRSRKKLSGSDSNAWPAGSAPTRRKAESDCRTSLTSRFGPPASVHAAGNANATSAVPPSAVRTVSSTAPGLNSGEEDVSTRSMPVSARSLMSAFSGLPVPGFRPPSAAESSAGFSPGL